MRLGKTQPILHILLAFSFSVCFQTSELMPKWTVLTGGSSESPFPHASHSVEAIARDGIEEAGKQEID